MRYLPALLLILLSQRCMAQDLGRRHTLIGQAYEGERYGEVVALIGAQLRASEGTTWVDSTHLYLYKYARAVSKVKGTNDGLAAGERVLALVQQRGRAQPLLAALFDLSWVYYEAGRLRDCVRLDSTALVVTDRDPAFTRAKRGQARQYLAFDYSILGEHRNSAKFARAALEQYAQAAPGEVPAVQWAESYTAVGAAEWHLGRIREAEAQYHKALDALGKDTTEAALMRKASTYGNLGVLWQNAGDLVKSRSNYQESLRAIDHVIARASDPFTRDEALVNRSRSYLNLATVYFACGDEGQAQKLLDLAWADRSKVLQPDDPQLLSVRERMADIQLAAGALEKARVLEEAYLVACGKKFGIQSEEYVRASSKLGEILTRQGRHARADSLFAISMAMGRRMADPATDPVRMETLMSRARLRSETGRRGEALKDLLEARAIGLNIYGPGGSRSARIEVLLAEQAFGAGQWEVARRHADRALDLLEDRLQRLRATRVPVVQPDPGLLPDAIYWKVKAEHALPVPDSVRNQWNALVDLAVQALGRNKTALSDAASKLRLVGTRQRLFDLALQLAYEDHARTGKEQELERFFQLSECNRSILLKDRLNEFAGLRFAGIPDPVMAREQELLKGLEIDPDDRTSITGLHEREEAYTRFLAHLEQAWPQYFQLRYGERTPTFAEVRKKLLAPDRQLVSYVWSTNHLYALVIGADRSHLVRIQAEGLAREVEDLQAAIERRASGEFVRSAHRLHERVVAPVLPLLSAKELLIVPGGPLGAVNFEVLCSAPGTKDFLRHLLIQRYTISYLLSATTALQFEDLGTDHTKGVLAMAPGFTEQVKQDYLKHMPDSSSADQLFLHYVRQPFAVRTAQALGRSASATVITGSQASEMAFRRTAATYGILFLGTHAEVNPVAPMYSRLVLSKDGAGQASEGDGYLHAYEIFELDLRAQLAVIAACESGSGRFDPGEGMRSLGAGFAYAGCPSLVMALWRIDEKATAAILARFHGKLAQGMPKNQALRQAKLEHLANAQDELFLPYYWAGLVLEGNVEPVQLGRSAQWPWWIAGLSVALAGLWWLRRRNNRAARSAGHATD
ncbi:MAG: CHAT domain-containing protein [Flavobacteriales bacterium]|nr:CHAT domain-containing protein [Flavobacteriales bacterium]